MTRVPIPLVVDADFFLSGRAEGSASMRIGSHTWYDWLKNNQNISFAFRNQQHVFTARRESQRHGWYWYAYRKRNGKTYKTYLGKSEELSMERLQEVATILSRKANIVPVARPALSPTLQTGASHASAASPLLMTKFSLPSLPAAGITRPHLVARLESGRQRKLTLLSAPAGWGKTVLLSSWCTMLSQQGVSFAWVTLDAQDSDLTTFWTTLIQAFQVVRPDLGNTALTLLYKEQAPLDVVVGMFIHELQSFSADMLLILDNCQHLPSAQQKKLAFFVDNLPACVHLVMASRTNPDSAFSTSRLRLQDQLLELRGVDLAFTVSETYKLLAETLHLPISAETCTQLTEHAEGWAAGLHLAALIAHGLDNPARAADPDSIMQAIASFDGSNRYVMDYVVEEVLLKLAPETQRFLMQTSILKHINPQICDAIRESSDSQAYLDELVQLNLCSVLPGQKQPNYHYHRLFGEALQARFQQTDPVLEAELQRRARLWYERQGMIAEALNYAVAAADDLLRARFAQRKEQAGTSPFEESNPRPVEQVTEREHDVLLLLVKGASNREIAQKLIISEGTVKKHVSNICSKLGVRRRTQVITRVMAIL